MSADQPFRPADFSKIKTHPIAARKSLVNLSMLASLENYRRTGKLSALLPPTLKAAELLSVRDAILAARARGAPVVAAMGAHVIKVGLSPIIIDLLERGILSAVAFNGAGAVHDLEIAFHGATSEDVAEEIRTGRFGMAEETSAHFNAALARRPDTGAGEAVGRYIVEERMPHARHSILARAFELGAPATLHIALGTDITHVDARADGAVIGRAAMADFKLFTGVVARLSGGVYLNIGSTALLPEVFIKSLSAARNMGHEVKDFFTVNMDMIQSYRPNVNVVNRPTRDGGRGVALTGHHEIMVPLLYHLLVGEGA